MYSETQRNTSPAYRYSINARQNDNPSNNRNKSSPRGFYERNSNHEQITAIHNEMSRVRVLPSAARCALRLRTGGVTRSDAKPVNRASSIGNEKMVSAVGETRK